VSRPGPVTSRLERLQFLRRALLQQLARVDRWIQRETLREENQRAEGKRAARAAERPWCIQHENGRPVRLHTVGCFFISRHDEGRACTRDEAIQALVQGAEACSGCQPDRELGAREFQAARLHAERSDRPTA
jgi:hypothetical protein